MTNFTDNIHDDRLNDGMDEWVFLGKQPHSEMSLADVKKHRKKIQKQAKKIGGDMKSGNLPYGPLPNIQTMHQNLVFNALLGQQQFEITGKHVGEKCNTEKKRCK